MSLCAGYTACVYSPSIRRDHFCKFCPSSVCSLQRIPSRHHLVSSVHHIFVWLALVFSVLFLFSLLSRSRVCAPVRSFCVPVRFSCSCTHLHFSVRSGRRSFLSLLVFAFDLFHPVEMGFPVTFRFFLFVRRALNSLSPALSLVFFFLLSALGLLFDRPILSSHLCVVCALVL